MPDSELALDHPPAGAGRVAAGLVVLWTALTVLTVLPVWTVDFLPSDDAPPHVDNANVLRKYGRGDLPFSRYYTIHSGVSSNGVAHAMLGQFLRFASPATAVKWTASVYLVLFPLSVLYAARGVSREGSAVAALAAPFGPHFLFVKGFYNFSLGMVVFFVLVGFYLRNRGRWNAVRAAGVAALGLLLYLCHPVTLVMGFVTVGVLALCDAVAGAGRRWPSWGALGRAAIPLVALAPAVLVQAAFFLRPRTDPTAAVGTARSPLGVLVKYLGTLAVLRSFADPVARAAVLLLLAGLVAIVGWALWRAWRGRRAERRDGLLAATGVAVLVYFAAPDVSSGGSFINARIALFPFLLAILWLAGQALPRAARRGAVALAVVCTAMLAFGHARAYRACDAYLRELCSVAPHVRPGSTLLPLAKTADALLRDVSAGVYALQHASGYVSAARDGVDLRNYEAALDYFPTRFRPEVDPTPYLFDDPVDIPGYLAATKGKASVDYVMLCPADQTLAPAVAAYLEANYVQTYRSPGGLVALYARRGLASESAARPPGGAGDLNVSAPGR
jgi:hypothetical protein